MALDDLKKRLFRKEESFEDRAFQAPLERHHQQAPSAWQEKPKMLRSRGAQSIMRWGFVIAALLVVLPGAYFLFTTFVPGISNDLDLVVEGAEEIASGKKAIWTVNYKNKSAIAYQNAVLTFEYPKGAQPASGNFLKEGARRERIDVGTIDPGKSGSESFSAILFGAEGETLEGKAVLEYRPENTSARLSREVVYRSYVREAVLSIDISIPSKLKAGQEVDIKARISSQSESVFRDLALRLEYPEAFEFISARPESVRTNNTWFMGDIVPGGEFIVTLHGKVKSVPVPQSFRAQVGLYDRDGNTISVFVTISKTFEVTAPLLALSLEILQGEISSGVTEAGKTVEMRIRWKNNLPAAVTNATLEISLNGELIDFRTLSSPTGEAGATTNSLRWLPGRAREFAIIDPGATGSVQFRFTLKKEAPSGTLDDKNSTIRMDASMTSVETPAGFEGTDFAGYAEKELRVASRVVLSQKGYFHTSRVVNVGPLPPKVGRETTYVIVWSLTNSLNDIGDVRVSAIVPAYMRWMGTVVPVDPTLTFDKTTRQVTWTPGMISAGTGYSGRTREVAFQVGLTPVLSQVSQVPELISEARLEAQDLFTKTAISQNARAVTANIPDDPETKGDLGRVVE